MVFNKYLINMKNNRESSVELKQLSYLKEIKLISFLI